MSLDKSRILKRGNSSRKFIPKKQRRAMTDPFVERITRTRTDKGETVSGRMVETRSQKSSEERKAMLEVEVHPEKAMNENQEIHGPEGRDRRLASESTPGRTRPRLCHFLRDTGPRGDVRNTGLNNNLVL